MLSCLRGLFRAPNSMCCLATCTNTCQNPWMFSTRFAAGWKKPSRDTMKPSDTIRIRTTARQTKLGLIVSRELVLVRRPSNAHVLDEPLAADGAFRTAEKILNLAGVPDGTYTIRATYAGYALAR